ncbi:MAG: Crp/Fnr family transcriptional regulator [Pseudomonadota bacterium]|nr:Crp/Fnr family transcriptional regulator [Pseudomonadota bacterium]
MQECLATTLFEKVPLFSGLSGPELTILGQHATLRTYPKNTLVINEGDEANALYVVISGQVKVFLSNEDGKEIIVNMQGPCEHFGELALLDSTPRSASVMTSEKTKLAIVSKSEFQRMLAKHPGIALSLIRDLTRRVRVLSDNVKSLALLDVYGRVAKTLLGMASDRDGKLIVEKRLTQQDIANRVGASREMVARIMKDLTTGGYISIANKQIVINERLPERY